MKNPELVLPGGDLERVKIAFLYGADAVYVGLDKYSLRKAEVRFSISEIKEAIEHAHNLGKKLYVTFNIFAHNKHLKTIEKDMEAIARLNPDAFIIADPGILNVAKRVAPKIPIHLSTQANTINSESVKFWYSLGVKRVVLGREVTLSEIIEIKKSAPEMELEIFVHGAMCVSYSGRCLLSATLTGRSSNLGECTQPCRWPYKMKAKPSRMTNDKYQRTNQAQISNNTRGESAADLSTAYSLQSTDYFLEEPTRPGELMEIQEDESGTYIMNSKDLCLIDSLEEIAKAGVDALKVEGRNKTGYYLASVAHAYREALSLISDAKYSKKDKVRLRGELEKITHRPYTSGFLFGDAKAGETFEGRDPIYGNKYVGYVENAKGKMQKAKLIEQKSNAKGKMQRAKNFKQGLEAKDQRPIAKDVLVIVKNKLKTNVIYEALTPEGIVDMKIISMKNSAGETIGVANPGRADEAVIANFDVEIPDGSFLREK